MNQPSGWFVFLSQTHVFSNACREVTRKQPPNGQMIGHKRDPSSELALGTDLAGLHDLRRQIES